MSMHVLEQIEQEINALDDSEKLILIEKIIHKMRFSNKDKIINKIDFSQFRAIYKLKEKEVDEACSDLRDEWERNF